MAYVLIESGVVVQKQPHAGDGFVEAPDEVVCGFLYDGEGFTAPEPEPIDPLTLSLSKRQVNAALILAGHTDPDAFIEAAIATVEDETARALALNDWRYAPYYKIDHPLFNDPNILAAADYTRQDIEGLWAVAATMDR